MREQLSEALKEAMREKDKRRLCTVRLIQAAIKDRDIAARGNGQDRISDADVLGLLGKMIKQREESAETYEGAGRLELAEQEREEIEIIRGFMPRQLDDEELTEAVRITVTDLGASGLRDMGKTINALKERHPGQFDAGKAASIVKGMLQEAG